MKINPLVLDISHYQTVSDFAKVRAFGIRGVIHKASESRGLVDKYYARRRKPAMDAGLLWGGYHFLRPGSVADQVENFLETVQPDASTLLALDHEDKRVPLDNAKEFLQRVFDKLGRWPVLYSGFLVKGQLREKDELLAKTRLWLAQYSTTPTWPNTWARPWLWQFTGDGLGPHPHEVPGVVEGKLDIDSYEGDATQLEKEWAA